MIVSNNGSELISDEYLKYFEKSQGSRVVQVRGDKKISDYLKFDLENHFLGAEKYPFCLNDSDSSLKHIREKEKKFSILQEGLIATYPTQKIVSHYRKMFSEVISKSLLNNSEAIDLVDFLELSDPNEDISPLVMICVPVIDSNDMKRIIKLFTDEFQTFGYYMTSYDTEPGTGFQKVFIQFEAKYTNMLVELEPILYHVSPLRNLQKILRNGLVPYSKSGEFKYSPKVYMFNKCQKEVVYDYATYKAIEINKDDGFCVFKVFKDNLLSDPLFKSGKQRFYLDPAFSLTDGFIDQTAIFTYGNIPLRILDNQYIEVHIKEGRISSEQVKTIK